MKSQAQELRPLKKSDKSSGRVEGESTPVWYGMEGSSTLLEKHDCT